MAKVSFREASAEWAIMAIELTVEFYREHRTMNRLIDEIGITPRRSDRAAAAQAQDAAGTTPSAS